MTRTFLVGVLAVTLAVLTGCSAPPEREPNPIDTDDPVWLAANYCHQLSDPIALEAARELWSGTDIPPGTFDQAVVECAATPDAQIAGVIERIVAEGPAQSLSPSVRRTETLSAELSDGYKASVDVTWYDVIAITTSEEYALVCPDRDPAEVQTHAIAAIKVQATVTYEVVNGFSWPSNSELSAWLVNSTDGGPSGVESTTCGETRGSSNEFTGWNRLDFPVLSDPSSATAWYVMRSEKTPNVPDGTITPEYIANTRIQFDSYPRPVTPVYSDY